MTEFAGEYPEPEDYNPEAARLSNAPVIEHLGASHLCLTPCAGISIRRVKSILYSEVITIKQTYNNFASYITHQQKRLNFIPATFFSVRKKFINPKRLDGLPLCSLRSMAKLKLTLQLQDVNCNE